MPRDDLIDTLRGLALFGILAVNIQSFVWGIGSPSLGILDEHSSVADQVSLFLTALLLEYKFYPIFCFCFGYGFAIQTRRWAVRGENIHLRFTRRMNFMLLMGVAHGAFLWFGDILARYAIAGLILRRHIRKGPRALLIAAKFWLAITVFTGAAVAFIGGALFSGDVSDAQRATTQQESERVFAIYTESGYVDATAQRMEDFFTITATYVLVLPQVMLFFLTGAIAAQLKWLRYPARYRLFWWRVFWFGLLLGLPISIAHAFSQLASALDPWAPPSWLAALAASFAPVLALTYVAAFPLLRANSQCEALIRLLAPAGRIALTLYITQSILLMLLLNGFGLSMGLGATYGQFALTVVATIMYALLLVVAHLMQRFALPAPLEHVWRKYTNHHHGNINQ